MSSNDVDQKFGLARFWDESRRKFFISKKLRMGINSSLEVVQSDGTQHSISAAQLSNLTPESAVQTLTAATTLTSEDSGKTLVLSDSTEFAVTLPSPANGLKFRFIVGAAPSGASYTVVSGTNVIQGSVTVDGAAVPGVNENTITFADGAAAVGDWAEVISDGTNWYVSGQGEATGSITLTAP